MTYQKNQTVIYKHPKYGKQPYTILETAQKAYHLRGIRRDDTVFSVPDTMLEPMLIHTRKRIVIGDTIIGAAETIKVKRLVVDPYLGDRLEIGAYVTWQGRQVYLMRSDFMTDEDLMKIA